MHAKPGVEPHDRQSPKLDRRDSSKSEDQPPLLADGSESGSDADEKSPPLVNSELTPPPAELPPLPDGFEPDQPSPRPVDSSGSDDKPPPAELTPPPDGFELDQPSPRPVDSSGSDDESPPPGQLPPLPDSSDSDEESPSVVDSEFTPAADDSSTSQATLIPRGKCNVPSLSGSPERTPDDTKALE